MEDKINTSKINTLLQSLAKGEVLLASWLVSKGYSYELQQRYRKSGWLKSIGRGAMVRTGDPLLLSGAISALQNQENMNIHIGGRSALEIQGLTHYLQLNTQELTLFADSKVSTPQWLLNNKWDFDIKSFRVSLLKNDNFGLVEYQDKDINMQISNSTRALMECLYLCPNYFSLTEAYELMEGLNSLRPAQTQVLLEQCKSIKVKRLFLYFAEKAQHSWVKYIDTKNINLGIGTRSLAKDGFFIPKYKLVLPKELMK